MRCGRLGRPRCAVPGASELGQVLGPGSGLPGHAAAPTELFRTRWRWLDRRCRRTGGCGSLSQSRAHAQDEGLAGFLGVGSGRRRHALLGRRLRRRALALRGPPLVARVRWLVADAAASAGRNAGARARAAAGRLFELQRPVPARGRRLRGPRGQPRPLFRLRAGGGGRGLCPERAARHQGRRGRGQPMRRTADALRCDTLRDPFLRKAVAAVWRGSTPCDDVEGAAVRQRRQRQQQQAQSARRCLEGGWPLGLILLLLLLGLRLHPLLGAADAAAASRCDCSCRGGIPGAVPGSDASVLAVAARRGRRQGGRQRRGRRRGAAPQGPRRGAGRRGLRPGRGFRREPLESSRRAEAVFQLGPLPPGRPRGHRRDVARAQLRALPPLRLPGPGRDGRRAARERRGIGMARERCDPLRHPRGCRGVFALRGESRPSRTSRRRHHARRQCGGGGRPR
mmetsp:Transcript_40564/g.130442  ORF Transcript_40564/g.130442 Transcript_40564/m.130442 type:complete len:453 (-) Transcript_40564:310-1668(-)